MHGEGGRWRKGKKKDFSSVINTDVTKYVAGGRDLPAIGEVSILELATHNGSSRMSQAPNLHLVMQFLTQFISNTKGKKWLPKR
mgnify:CR=1 FL=1